VRVRRLVALQFYAQIAPRSARFQWPVPADLLEVQSFLLDDLSLHRFQSEEASASYTRTFLKELIARLEAALGTSGDAEAVSMVDSSLKDALRVRPHHKIS
jgi:hypothetical protein